jgi:hypothetical protein
MRIPDKKFIFENTIKVIIINIILFITLKIPKPQFYFYYSLLCLTLIYLFSYLDDKIDPDEPVYFKKLNNHDIEKRIKRKRRHHNFWDKLYFKLTSPSKSGIYIIMLILALVFYVFGNKVMNILPKLIGSLIDWLTLNK